MLYEEILVSVRLYTTIPHSNPYQVTMEEAGKAALSILQGRKGVDNASITGIESMSDSNNNIVMYEVQTSENTSVLLSGNKNCRPLLGFYECSQGSLLHDSTDIPEGLRFLLDWYYEQIVQSFDEAKMGASNVSVWDSIVEVLSTPSAKSLSSVGPLTTSSWGQSFSNDRYGDSNAYNYYIPAGGSCSHQLVGCVAVAMGQLMYYWKYPVWNNKRVQQFDWCNMTDLLYSYSTNYEANRNAIATLLSDCGLAVDMEYGCDASGANMKDAAEALENKYGFDYPDSLGYKRRIWNRSDWINMIKRDLDNGYPVVYSGDRYDTTDEENRGWSGHAFICDGYNSQGLFHFNWGWRGDYSTPESYFDLDDLNPGGNRNYKFWHDAIFGVRPKYNQDMCDITLHIEDYYSAFAIYEQMGNPFWSYIPETMTHLVSASSGSDPTWRTIEYVAHKSITLQPGFHAERGSTFSARIVPCSKCESEDSALTTRFSAIIACDSVQDSAMNAKTILVNNDAEEIDHHLFPNPSHETITYRGKEVSSMAIYDLSGRAVYRWFVVSKTADEIVVNVKDLRPSTYVLLLNMSDGTREAMGFVKY